MLEEADWGACGRPARPCRCASLWPSEGHPESKSEGRFLNANGLWLLDSIVPAAQMGTGGLWGRPPAHFGKSRLRGGRSLSATVAGSRESPPRRKPASRRIAGRRAQFCPQRSVSRRRVSRDEESMPRWANCRESDGCKRRVQGGR